MHGTSHHLSRTCKKLLCEYAPEEPNTLLIDVDVRKLVVLAEMLMLRIHSSEVVGSV